MVCKKCKKDIPDGSLYCNFCGKKQETTPRKRTHKRAHGSGTIHKDERYSKPYIAYAPPNFAGKRAYIGAYSTYSDAQEALELYNRHGKPDLINATLSEIYDLWSAMHYENLATGTVNQYKSAWKRFSPLYKSKISDLRAVDFQALIDNVGHGTASIIKVLAKSLCDYAMENDIVQKNYADFIRLPKKESKPEKAVFTSAQITELWKHTDDDRVRVILAMIYMGFRIGEITALTVDDVHISEGYVIAGIKTEAGKNRIIPFPPNIPEIAEYFRDWCEKACTNGRLWDMNGISFRNKMFYAPLVEYGLLSADYDRAKQIFIFSDKHHITPHSTRHTFASLSAAAGMRPDDLQKIIGHANYTTTADIYVHKDIEHLKSEMSKLSR